MRESKLLFGIYVILSLGFGALLLNGLGEVLENYTISRARLPYTLCINISGNETECGALKARMK